MYCGCVRDMTPLKTELRVPLQAAGAAVTKTYRWMFPKGGKGETELTYQAAIKFLKNVASYRDFNASFAIGTFHLAR